MNRNLKLSIKLALSALLIVITLFLVSKIKIEDSDLEGFIKNHYFQEKIRQPTQLEIQTRLTRKYGLIHQRFGEMKMNTTVASWFNLKSIQTRILDGEQQVSNYIEDAWVDWQQFCKKEYESAEVEAEKRNLWENNLKKNEDINNQPGSFSVVNDCTMDLSKEEFNKRFGGISQDFNQLLSDLPTKIQKDEQKLAHPPQSPPSDVPPPPPDSDSVESENSSAEEFLTKNTDEIKQLKHVIDMRLKTREQRQQRKEHEYKNGENPPPTEEQILKYEEQLEISQKNGHKAMNMHHLNSCSPSIPNCIGNTCYPYYNGYCQNCEPGYYMMYRKCESCPENCIYCQDKNWCYQGYCKDGFVRNNEGKCTACNPVCSTCDMNDPKKCLGCKDGKALLKGRCVETPKYVSWSNIPELPVLTQWCGDCWAHGAVSAVEAQLQIIGKPYTAISIQHIDDCTYQPRNGCEGGDPASPLQYMIKNGYTTAEKIKYEGEFNPRRDCVAADLDLQKGKEVEETNLIYDSSSTHDMGDRNCNRVKAALMTGPVAVALCAGGREFDGVTSNIVPRSAVGDCGYNPYNGRSYVNHVVMLVAATPQYWVIQNSWGRGWATNGYARLAMGDTLGICGGSNKLLFDSPQVLQPLTTEFDFVKTWGSKGRKRSCTQKSTPPCLSLDILVGTQLVVIAQLYSGSNLVNEKGEKLQRIDSRYHYIMETRGLDQEGQILSASFVFINRQTGGSFDIVFTQQDGLLQSTNTDKYSNLLLMGRCTLNQSDLFADLCQDMSDSTFFIYTKNRHQSDRLIFQFEWAKPPK